MSVVVLRYGDAQSDEQQWEGIVSSRGSPGGIWDEESTEEREAEVVGCRPEGKEGCCWWTCSDQLWCSGRGRAGSWDEPAVLVSWENWSKETNWNLMEKVKNTSSSDSAETVPLQQTICLHLPPPECSGAGERHGVEGPGERL